MTSRERLLKALVCEIPDRVPISTLELCGYNSKRFENNTPSYKRLMDYIREKTDCATLWNPGSNQRIACSSYAVPQTVEVEKGKDWISRRYHIETPKGKLSYQHKVFDNVNTTWVTEHLCKDIDDVDKVMSIPYEPVDYDFSDYERIKKEVGDNGIIMVSMGDPLNHVVDLMEFGEATVWAMTETEHFTKTIETMHERTMENLRRLLEHQIVDLYRIYGPEYATVPYLPPSYFQRFVTPYVKEMVDLIHSKGAKVRMHSHGKIKDVIPMILETGVDALDPCEAPPDGNISLREVKELTGGRISIWGNLQLKLLEHGSAEQVREEVKACMDAAKEGGGYIIMPTAGPINDPLSPKTEENYMAFIDAALEYGKY